VHVLDDGFQHLRLARDLDVLCVSAGDLEDRPMPAGCLREFPSAVSRAHVVLWNGGGEARQPGRETYQVKRQVDGFFDLEGRPHAAPRRPYLLAGIARPDRFASDVASLTGDVAGRAFFRDHHRFERRELETADETARSLGADALVTTAKDAVRLPAAATTLPVLVLKISAAIAQADAFTERLLTVARGVA
jgi:tetraacyldisaccharide 4'-kinase